MSPSLQWGRGLSTPEMHRNLPTVRSAHQASMGPGSFDPGNGLRRPYRASSSKASMGPGSFDPGNSSLHYVGYAIDVRFNGAGVFRPRKFFVLCRAKPTYEASMGPGSFDPGNGVRAAEPADAAPGLQWGRGLSTPEMNPSISDVQAGLMLQWGRGLSTPEIRCPATAPRLPDWLQWGRGLSTPEIRAERPQKTQWRSFNGAGVFRPRKSG